MKVNEMATKLPKAKPGSFGALPTNERTMLVNGDMTAINKNLTSLEGCPEVIVGGFNVDENQSLTSLLGGPREVSSYYSAERCGLTSLDGLPGKIGGFLSIDINPLTSLQGINKLKEMVGNIFVSKCPIKSHILGVFFIKGCTGVNAFTSDGDGDLFTAAQIVNRYIGKGRAGLLPCQQELIEAGLVDFAQI
jgi:hypothetical protein